MNYSYDNFVNDIARIEKAVINSEKHYDYIVGIVRGGAIPAVCLSHKLGLPMKCVSWSTFHGEQMKESAWDIAEDIADGKRVLVVDDILDSGRTFRELLEDWDAEREQIDIAVLIHNTDQGIVPDYCGRTIDKSIDPSWITFWWEQGGDE
jgi:hypoxanthine phosphoribosyltransferase